MPLEDAYVLGLNKDGFSIEQHMASLLVRRYGPSVTKPDFFQYCSWIYHFPKPVSKALLLRMQELGLVRVERYGIMIVGAVKV